MAGAQVSIRNEESWYLQTNTSLIGNLNVDTVLDSIDIKKEQQLDPDIVKLLERKRSGEKLNTTITDSWYLKKLGREYRRLIIHSWERLLTPPLLGTTPPFMILPPLYSVPDPPRF